MTNEIYDLIILGGGAAGLFSALHTQSSIKKVLILEGNKSIGKKIRISGGGRCNFSNKQVSPVHFISSNKHFVKSALVQYTNNDFINLVKKYKISFFDKGHGQLFCKESSTQIISMLEKECLKVGAVIKTNEKIVSAKKEKSIFTIKTAAHNYQSKNLILATGGLSMSAIGATDVGYTIAKSFGHKIIDTKAGLVPLRLTEKDLSFFSCLSGVSQKVNIMSNKQNFHDDLLFTHRGLSGPAVLQISNYWKPGDEISINFLPDSKILDILLKAKKRSGAKQIENFLSRYLPSRLVNSLLKRSEIGGNIVLSELSNTTINIISESINNLKLKPRNYDGMNKAEVTRGGVATNEISSKTMESQLVKGLYFVGEVMDVTGQLGGYNFQWAWSSGYVAGSSVSL